MSWDWPQWLYVGITIFVLIGVCLMDGKPRTGDYSAGVTIITIFLGNVILYFGGFWTP